MNYDKRSAIATKRNMNYRNTVYWERYLDDALKAQATLEKRIAKIKQVIELRYKNELSLREIGKILKCSGENVRLLLEKFRLS